MSTLDTKGIIPECLPVLADVNGKIPLDAPNVVPPAFQDVAEKFFAAVRGGARLIILDARQSRPKRQKDSGQSDQDILIPDADFYQFIWRGLVPLTKNLRCVAPDDQQWKAWPLGITEYKPAEIYEKLERDISDAEEHGESMVKPYQQGIIVALTHDTTDFFSDFPKFANKARRVFPQDEIATIPFPNPHVPNLYASWADAMLAADTSRFRELLLQAASHPAKFSNIDRANTAWPGKAHADVHTHQEETFRVILSLFQAQLWGRPSVLLYGDYGTGKTSLMVAQGQLMHQLGYKVSYRTKEMFHKRCDTDTEVSCVDQLEDADYRIRGVNYMPNIFQAELLEHGRYIATSNQHPCDIEALMPADHGKGSGYVDLGEKGNVSADRLPRSYPDFLKKFFAVQWPGPSWVQSDF